MPKTLTERQRRFALEYAKTGNATESARTVGYKQPAKVSWALKNTPLVLDEIKKLRANVEESAYQYLKSVQLETAKRMFEIVQHSKDGIAVQAGKEILKDVLVSREETTNRNENLNKTPQDILAELSQAVNALTPEEKQSLGALVPTTNLLPVSAEVVVAPPSYVEPEPEEPVVRPPSPLDLVVEPAIIDAQNK